MKNIRLPVVVLIGVGVIALLGWRWTTHPDPAAQTQRPPVPPTRAADSAGAKQDDLDGEPTPKDRQKAARWLAEATAAEAKRFSTDRVAHAFQVAVDAKGRWLALAELQDRRFPSADAIRVLKAALADPDIGVRVYAADLLYQLGSAAGKDTLLDAIRSAASVPPEALLAIINAAQILNRNKEMIPSDLLIGLQKEVGPPGVLDIMAMQRDPRYAPFLLATAKEEPAGSVFYLGVFGAPEGYAIAKQLFESTQNEQVKVAAAWALFRITGERSALDYVMAIAEHELTDVNGIKGVNAHAVQQAMRELYITKDDSVRELLRQIVYVNDTTANRQSLASLFYVQQDYEFVDNYVRVYLQNPKAYQNIDSGLIGRIAAARNQPEINALAEQSDPVFRQFYFDPMRGLPVESWIGLYLSNLPLHLDSASKKGKP